MKLVKLCNYTKRLSRAEREEFAAQCGTTIAHLNNVQYGLRTASAALARQVAELSGGQVPVSELRPRDWHLIWPELAKAKRRARLAAPATL